MKKLLLFIAFIMLFITSCETTPTSDQVDQHKQEVITSQGVAQAGMPNITNFNELKTVNLAYEMRDNVKLIQYVYLQSELTGKLIYVGRCTGLPIPYATQRSNPEKLVQLYSGSNYITMPQSEPNGLFSPTSADGTIVMMIDPKDNTPKLCYFEPKVTVLPFKIDM